MEAETASETACLIEARRCKNDLATHLGLTNAVPHYVARPISFSGTHCVNYVLSTLLIHTHSQVLPHSYLHRQAHDIFRSPLVSFSVFKNYVCLAHSSANSPRITADRRWCDAGVSVNERCFRLPDLPPFVNVAETGW